MKIYELDTPSLIIDRERLECNLADMVAYARKNNVALRPHTKTHKMPEIPKMQLAAGSTGIAVAKVGEAEVMFAAGIKDILIANEPVGRIKWERIAKMAAAGAEISFGVDCPEQVAGAEAVFAVAGVTVSVQVEIEVGDLVRIIPVHICPVCNLYSEAALVSGDEVIEMLAVAGQGKIQ